MAVKAVKNISNAKVVEFVSTALKYPYVRMSEKTRI